MKVSALRGAGRPMSFSHSPGSRVFVSHRPSRTSRRGGSESRRAGDCRADPPWAGSRGALTSSNASKSSARPRAGSAQTSSSLKPARDLGDTVQWLDSCWLFGRPHADLDCRRFHQRAARSRGRRPGRDLMSFQISGSSASARTLGLSREVPRSVRDAPVEAVDLRYAVWRSATCSRRGRSGCIDGRPAPPRQPERRTRLRRRRRRRGRGGSACPVVRRPCARTGRDG